MKNVFYVMLLLATVPASATPLKETKIAPAGDTSLQGQLGAAHVEVVISTHTIDIGKPGTPAPATVQHEPACTYTRYPCSVVDKIDIRIGGVPVAVPQGAFADLADLNRGRLQAAPGVGLLMLAGGDGADAYKLTIAFDAHRVLWRKRASGEFPQNYAVTVFHYDDAGAP